MSSSSMLKLPVERRNTIWDYALMSDTKALHYDTCTKRLDVSRTGLRLLSTLNVC